MSGFCLLIEAMIGLTIRSMYVRRPLNMNEALSSTMGPSTMNFEARMETFAVP